MMRAAPIDNDIAEGPFDARAFWIHGEDLVLTRVAVWDTRYSKKGTIFIFPGNTGYVERYGRLSSRLVQMGFGCLVVEWRGTGLSDRITNDKKIVHIDHFDEYQQDVHAMVNAARELELPEPWFLLGNSMGGCIGLRALLNGLPVAACAFASPMWGINLSPLQRLAVEPVTWVQRKRGRDGGFAPGQGPIPYVKKVSFEDNALTGDLDMYRYWKRQCQSELDLQTGGPSLRWLQQALRECRRLSREPSPNVPCISFSGREDRVVDQRAIAERMARWPKGKITEISGARHDVLAEVEEIRTIALSQVDELFSIVGAVTSG